MGPMTVMLAPGNGGGGSLEDAIWYPWIRDKLVEKYGEEIRFVLKEFPDPTYAREQFWLPFLEAQGAAGGVIIGHSSGAAAALRYAENTKVAGLALCAAYDSDLGDELERASGYFNREWDWEKIKANCGFIIQLHSHNDHLVPFKEGKKVADAIGSEFVPCRAGHFQDDEIPELLETIVPHLDRLVQGE
eukprot:Hpha_TRINITY_DN20911_c0_g1::TRINITY_DN20911_c0_g1_i1::g.139715::m.139715/K07002/K07002; uncharacterized protein